MVSCRILKCSKWKSYIRTEIRAINEDNPKLQIVLGTCEEDAQFSAKIHRTNKSHRISGSLFRPETHWIFS